MSRRTQPYRATSARQQSSALVAMQRGRGLMASPGDHRRRAMKKKRKRKGRARYSGSLQQVLGVRRKVARG